jgi:hypothetical protein
MLSDLNWKRANVRAETQCSRCNRLLLAGQQSIQIDRSRVCIQCWDEVRADPTKTAQEYKRELKIGSGTPTRRTSSGGRSGGSRKPAPRLQPTLSAYDASLLVANALDRAAAEGSSQVLPAGDLPFFEPGFDHLVVGRAGATIVGSKQYSSSVQIEALVSWSSTSIPANVLANGRNLRELVDLAVEQRDELEALITSAKFKFDVPVSVALCFESVEGIDRTPVRDSLGVRIDTAENIAKHVTSRGPVFEEEIAVIADFLRQDATPAPQVPDQHPATG